MQQSYSEGGRYLAYSLSSSGSDWQEIHIQDVDTRREFDEVIQWCKFPAMAWKPDKSGFFYNRLPEPGSVPPEDQNHYSRVCWHALGTPQSADARVYEAPDDKDLSFHPHVTEDGDYLALFTGRGTDRRNGFYLRRAESDGEFQHLIEDGEAKFWPAGNVGSIFYFLTDLNAPSGGSSPSTWKIRRGKAGPRSSLKERRPSPMSSCGTPTWWW